MAAAGVSASWRLSPESIGTGAFTGTAGELRFEQINGKTIVQGDTNGDGVADFWIGVAGLQTLNADDFLL